MREGFEKKNPQRIKGMHIWRLSCRDVDLPCGPTSIRVPVFGSGGFFRLRKVLSYFSKLSRVVWLDPLTHSQSHGAHPTNDVIHHIIWCLKKVEKLGDRALAVSPELWQCVVASCFPDLPPRFNKVGTTIKFLPLVFRLNEFRV